MSKGEVRIKIIGDASKFGSALDDADGHMGTFAGKASGFAGKIAGVVGGAFAVDAIIGFGTELFTLGSSLEVFDRKANTVFEGSANDVKKWADANNEAFGMSDEAMVGLAANFGDLLKPMGFTADQAAGMSKEVVGLSGALSAWSGGSKSSAEVSEVLAKAMLGERDGLKELGIAISEADVTARLAAKGQSELTGAAEQQAKAVATQELIFEKSTDAQKAWSDGSMDGIKNTNEMKATFDDLKATMAEKLLPIGQKLVGWVVDDLIPAGKRFVDSGRELADEWGPKLSASFVYLWGIVSPIFDQLMAWWDANGPAIIARVSEMGSKVGEIFTGIGEIVMSVLGFIKSVWDNYGDLILNQVKIIWETISGVISGVMSVIKGIIDVVMGIIKGDWGRVWDGIKGIVSGVWGVIVSIVSGAINFVWENIKMVGRFISDAWSFLWEGVKSIVGGVWNWITSTISSAISGIVGFFGSIGSKASEAWDTAKSAAVTVIDWFKGVPDKLRDALSSMWDGMKSGFKSVLNWIIDKWNGLSFSIPKFDIPGIGSVGGGTISVPKIPRLAEGGIALGKQLAIIGDNKSGAEAIVPLERASEFGFGPGGSGSNVTSITVNIDAGIAGDPVAIGRRVSQVLEEYARVS